MSTQSSTSSVTAPADRKVVPITDGRKMTMMKSSVLNYPELWLEVFIVGDDFEQRNFADMLLKAKCRRAASPEESDFVIFTGGVDVDPALYGETPHPMTDKPDHKRDATDMDIYKRCLDIGIPMVGVCRGAQFLHVMNGGKLYQHVTNHNGKHNMYVIKDKANIEVSSVHHQMVIRNSEMQVLGDAGCHSKERWKNANDFDTTAGDFDIEAFLYPETFCFGVQGHPEYSGFEEFTVWTLNVIQDLVLVHPDTELRGRYRRVKQDIIDQRNANWSKTVANGGGN